MHIVAKQPFPDTDVVGYLRHKEGFAHLGRSRQQVKPRVQQAVNHRRLAGVIIVVQFVHGNGVEKRWVPHPLNLLNDFVQLFLLVRIEIAAFLCYTDVVFTG